MGLAVVMASESLALWAKCAFLEDRKEQAGSQPRGGQLRLLFTMSHARPQQPLSTAAQRQCLPNVPG